MDSTQENLCATFDEWLQTQRRRAHVDRLVKDGILDEYEILFERTYAPDPTEAPIHERT